MKRTPLLTVAIAIVALSLLFYGCGPSAQVPEKKVPATNAPAVAPLGSVNAPEVTPPAAPKTAAAINQATAPDSDLNVNQGVDESNPADLPEPSAPE